MEGPGSKARRQRRTMALAMLASVAVHAAVLAWAKIRVPLPTDGDDPRTAEAGPADWLERQRPLEVVRLRTEAAQSADAAASAATSRAGSSEASPTDGTPTPRAAAAPTLSTEPAETRSEFALAVTLDRPESDAAKDADSWADANEGVVFEPASEAAREATKGRSGGRGAGRGGIRIGIGGAGGHGPGGACPAPDGGLGGQILDAIADLGPDSRIGSMLGERLGGGAIDPNMGRILGRGIGGTGQGIGRTVGGATDGAGRTDRGGRSPADFLPRF